MNIVSNFSDYYDKLQQHGIDKTISFVRINKQHFKFDKMNVWQVGVNSIENELTEDKFKKMLSNGNLPNIVYNYPQEQEKPFEALRASFHNITRNAQRNSILKTKLDIDLEPVYAVVNAKVFCSYMILQESVREELCLALSGASFHYDIVKKNATPEDVYHFLRTKKDMFQALKSFDKESVDDVLLNSKNFEEYCKIINEKKLNYNSWEFRSYTSKYSETKNLTENDLNELHKQLDSPIFFVIGGKAVTSLPLNYFGLTKIFDGNVEQLYQEISYCVGNTIKNKNEPPIAISDLDKVVQHGFDKKVSFRNRG